MQGLVTVFGGSGFVGQQIVRVLAKQGMRIRVAVREVFPGAVILRPSVIFGAADQFFNRFAGMAMIAPALPLIGGGETRFQPVYVSDVAAAVGAALTNPAAEGRTFELGGPQVYSFKALMQLTLRVIERSRILAPVPFPLANLLGLAGDLVARTGLIAPPITRDQVALLRYDNVVSPGASGLADLGINPTALEPIIPTYLYRYRKGGQYAEQTRTAQAAIA